MIEDETISEPRKKNIKAIFLVLVFLSIAVPFSVLSLLPAPNGHTEQSMTYREFHHNYHYMQLEDGDLLLIRDTFSDLWFNASSGYTFMTFESMDETRTASWGYDAGIPRDITDEFSVRNKVEIELEIIEDIDPQGNPRLIAHIIQIKRV